MLRKQFAFRGIVLIVLSLHATQAITQAFPPPALPAPLSSPDGVRSGLNSYSDSSSEATGALEPPLTSSAKPKVQYERTRPFSSLQIGVKATSLGAGLDLATPLTQHLGLRSQFNMFHFDYLFNIDGVDYDSRFKLCSGSFSLDWFPTRHSFRVSPGVLYFNNNLQAVSGVPAGNYFELGDQGFINSVDDPLNGKATVVFPRHVAPMVTFGYNLVGGKDGRFTMPVELGLAYTGAAKIDVTLNGTACTNDGCFTFAENPEAQQSMQQEIAKLNRNLSDYPVYPIVSVGFAYRFGLRR